jgi:hypothetical protein
MLYASGMAFLKTGYEKDRDAKYTLLKKYFRQNITFISLAFDRIGCCFNLYKRSAVYRQSSIQAV